MLADVQKHYLGEKSAQFWLIRVDMNRLSIKNEPWAFYELLLSSIVLELVNHDIDDNIRTELVDLDSRVIQNKDQLLALRFFEMAASRLCQAFDLRLCFLLDEFDEAYKTLPREIFSQLRAVRDANKNRVAYGIFLRKIPEKLRVPIDNESFYELLSRNMLGLGPYSKADMLQIVQQLEARREFPLTPAQRERFYEASGGHVGLVQGMLSIVIEVPQAIEKVGLSGWIEGFGRQPACEEECRKIWEGLEDDEQAGLLAFVKGEQNKTPISVTKLLFAKGLLQTSENGTVVFSPIFEQYLRTK